MRNIQDVTETIIKEFVNNDTLFTALDVSNKVKEILPLVKHREVREIVRASFPTIMTSASYTRTPIKVTLQDGTSVDALLYHHLSDSLNLESKYDDQKRSQTAVKPTDTVAPTTDDSTAFVDFSATNAVAPPLTPTQLWKNLFSSVNSLFSK